MAFTLDDIVIDRIQYGVAEDFSGNLLYTLTQLKDASINITAESKDATDANGTLIKRFYTGKTGEFSATNALLNLNILASSSGNPKLVADTANAIEMPRIIKAKQGETIELNSSDGVSVFVPGSVRVNAIGNNGAMGKAYTQGTASSATEFGLTTTGKLTVPADTDVDGFIIKYQRTVNSGVAIHNSSDKFPDTIRLTLKALAVDPCSADTLRAVYIVLPSFQPSPEAEITLSTEEGVAYSGQLQADFCSDDKELYAIYMADEEEDE